MAYLASERSRLRRADPKQILPECKSILVLATPYDSPLRYSGEGPGVRGQIASYALGHDYHDILPSRLKALVAFIEKQVGGPVANRYYTDTGPLLERDLAQRAGLGWIGKNTMLIHPRVGSYFLLAEILLDLVLEPDTPLTTDHCGTCTRCIQACPTNCILPNRTLDARRCISYLTIELKDDIPLDLRPLMQDWIFGCDACQQACPWNRFAALEGDASFRPPSGSATPNLIPLLALTPESFNQQFKHSPLKRTKRRGLIRNISVALGNSADESALPALDETLNDPDPLIRQHAYWAREQIVKRKT